MADDAKPDEAKLAEIRNQRGSIYGPPEENHRGIAQIWASILQPHWQDIRDMKPLPTWAVYLLMVGVKLNRMRLVYHPDNYDDARNYLRFAEEAQRPKEA